MMGLAVIVGATLASPTHISGSWLSIMYGCITGFALTAASMAINDYHDRAIDAINEPKRPIPSGVIKPKEALAFASILTAIGFVAAYLTNTVYPLPLLTAIMAWIVFITYTTIGKRSGLPGNLLVSACVAIPFIYGSVALTAEVKLNVLLFASMAFLSNTGREVTKGIVDIEGDKTQNVKTLAVRYGDEKAVAAAIAFFLSAVLLSPIPWLLDLVSVWFFPFVLVTDVGLAASSFALFRDHSREKARRIKNIVLLLFVFGLLAFIFGLLRWP
jgi:geranylgeranylglycerol-phosphate geranylgeranyltransferase